MCLRHGTEEKDVSGHVCGTWVCVQRAGRGDASQPSGSVNEQACFSRLRKLWFPQCAHWRHAKVLVSSEGALLV